MFPRRRSKAARKSGGCELTCIKAGAAKVDEHRGMKALLRHFVSLALLAVFSIRALAAEQPSSTEILAKLSKDHPRLLAKKADFSALRKKVAAQPEVGRWAAEIRKDADKLLGAEPSKYVIPDGKRLLATSRRVFDRTVTLGMAFRLSGDVRYRERLWRELDAAAKFKDWNPSHFLDTAEMTAAFAIGYDWLHAEWTPAQRAALRMAIVEKGLKTSLDVYRRNRWWAACDHNWNQVCNGGMTLGALAVAEEEPALSGEILAAAIRSVPRAMQQFAPDGAWGEGPGYWDYATRYNVLMLAALDSALGGDFGLSRIEGFAKTGDFPIQMTGPLKRSFNYADAGEGSPGGAQLFWLATKFQNPAFAAWRMGGTMRTPSALDLLWGAAWIDRKPSLGTLPLARNFGRHEIVAMRSAWDDADATFVGFKGGDNKVNHGHLDLGSFVLDAAGRRWAMDLGADDYNLPGYFGSGRWNFYRCRAEGHNALVLDPDRGPDQDPRAVARITDFKSGTGHASAVADLSAGYAKSAASVRRGIALAGREVTVQDEVRARKPTELWWFMHTTADITCDGATATLTLDGRKLTARILSPAGASFQVMQAGPSPASPKLERQQLKGTGSHGGGVGVRKLAIKLTNITDVTLTVLLSPGSEEPSRAVKALAKW